ncbi:hypothetical protein HDU86_006525 [Geranomyces michiganensis]|nr:hypothetical protein HDU86_006525 [Geranomyces michiganensis]
MPRKEFRNDLAALIATSGRLETQGVKGVTSGGEDGEIAFEFHYDAVHWLGVSVHIQDLHLYPHGSSGVVYLGDGHIDQRAEGAAQVVESVNIHQEPLSSVVENITQALSEYFSKHSDARIGASTNLSPINVDSQSFQSASDVSDEESDANDAGFEEKLLNQIHKSVRSLLLRDVRQLRSAGYPNVGYLTSQAEKGFILYVTIPVQSLISSGMLTLDQCEAWNLHFKKHLVLLMKFEPDYIHVIRKPSNGQERMYLQGHTDTPSDAVSITTSDGPQIATHQAFTCFRKSTANKPGPTSYELLQEDPQSSFAASLLNLPSSNEYGGAKATKRKTARNNAQVDDVDLWDAPGESAAKAGDPWSDHLNFPLLAIRYTLRRLVDCSKHCLVCHKLITTEFKALKPYVCTASLCNHQYMQLGLGPSIELEIINQPCVVDLLVSLAYTATAQGQMNPFPAGIGYAKVTRVPFGETECSGFTVESDTYWRLHGSMHSSPSDVIEINMHSGEIYRYAITQLLTGGVAVETRGPRIPAITIGRFLDASLCHLIRNEWIGWDQNATCEGDSKDLVIFTLAKLPPIQELRATLEKQLPCKDSSKEAVEVTSDATNVDGEMTEEDRLKMEAEKEQKRLRDERDQKLLDRQTTLSLRPVLDQIDQLIYPLLRWIICSNRSFIKELRVDEEKVTGIGAGHLQFKMVMSTPEKEEIFLKEQKQWVASNAVQSLWAFHGSPLYNWHSILRTGLNTQKVTHGRAHGHGIYHALDYGTSSGYASVGGNAWPNSKIGVTQCLSLNEIVNCPGSFVSQNPYLVVGNINWRDATPFIFTDIGYGCFAVPNQLQQPPDINVPAAHAARHNQAAVTAVTCEVPFKAYLPMDPYRNPRGAQNHAIRIPAASVAVHDSLARAFDSAAFTDDGLAKLEREETDASGQG